MKHKFTRNIGLKILSLLVAFLIWLLVANVDDPTQTVLFKNIKITMVNTESVTELDKVFAVVEDDVYGDAVIIKVTERSSVLKTLKTSDFKVIADMEAINEVGAIPLRVECSNPSVTLDEMEVIPSVMKVTLEQKKQSDFVVTVTTTGSVANGYEVGTKEVVQGKTVQIAGPESLLNKIGKVVADVNVRGLDKSIRKTVDLQIYDKNEEALSDSQMARLQIKDSSGILLSNNEVMVDITLWEVMSDIPVEIHTTGTPADGYRVAGISTMPVTVNLVGTKEALARLNGKITAQDSVSVEGATENVSAEIDLSETLGKLEGIRLVADTDPTISVTVQIEKSGDQTLQVPLSSLEVHNRPDTDKISLVISPADQIQVAVHADEEGEPSLSISDIKASVDLADCAEEGVYEIPVEIQLPDGYSLVSPVSLVVTAQKIQEETQTEN